MSRLLRVFWLSIALGGCIDRYTPDVPAAAQANLVVDGYINPLGSTVIKLSHTFSINTKGTKLAEARAQVVIQDDAGRRYGLNETTSGTYVSASQTLDPARQYQVRITTAAGRQYASDLVPAVLTPPIDQLSWQPSSAGGVQIYLDTHGASAAARYYRWDYDETWQFTSAYQSAVQYVAGTNTIEPRTLSNQIYTCWRTESSANILQGSTTQLSQNAIAAYPLLLVPPTNKLKVGYSILVRQYAEAQPEYDYWELLRKTTEGLGTANDPLPARVTGNVHALADPAELVLGYVGAHSVAERRLFIDAALLPLPRPGSIFLDPNYAKCDLTLNLTLPYVLQQAKAGASVPVTPYFDLSGNIISCDVGSVACVDCRQYGTNVKPSYWP